MTVPNVRIVPPATTGLLKDLPYGTVVEWNGEACVVVYRSHPPSNNRQVVSLREMSLAWWSIEDWPLPILGRLEVTNGVSDVKAANNGIDWKARAEKFEGWLKEIVSQTGQYSTFIQAGITANLMRKDGLL